MNTDNRTDEERRAAFRARGVEMERKRLAETHGVKTLAERINDAETYMKFDVALREGYGTKTSCDYEVHNVEVGRMMTHRGHTFLNKLHKVCFVDDDERGVYGYAFGLGSMLTAQRCARAPSIELKTGDVVQVVIGGRYYDFLVEWKRGEWMYLHRINPDGTLEPRLERDGSVAWSY